MRWARVQDDSAVEVIDFDPAGRFHPAVEALFTVVPDHVRTGARLVDGEWVNPPEPPPLTPEMIAAQQELAETTARERQATLVREDRNSRLTSSDWTQTLDAPVDQQAWATYRQALRDLPSQVGFPDDVVWPTPPSNE